MSAKSQPQGVATPDVPVVEVTLTVQEAEALCAFVAEPVSIVTYGPSWVAEGAESVAKTLAEAIGRKWEPRR